MCLLVQFAGCVVAGKRLWENLKWLKGLGVYIKEGVERLCFSTSWSNWVIFPSPSLITLVFAVFVGQNVLMFIHREEEKKRGQLLMGGMNHNFFIYWVNTISKWWMQGWCLQSCSAEIERKLLTASFCHSFTWCISRAEWSRVGTVSTAGRKPHWDKPLLFSFQLTNSSLMCFLWKYIWTGLFSTVKLEI